MPINAPIYSVTGKALGEQPLPKEIFGVPVNEALIAQALRTYTSRQRQNTKKVKTRGEVNFTTKKMWAQKGTGRARHGSRRAPTFVGGGVAHGPTGNENYTLRISKKMRRKALYSALSLHAQNHTITLVESLDTLDGKTKSVLALFKKLYPSPTPTSLKILLILDSPHPATLRSVKNITHLTPTQAKRLNLFEVINHRQIIFTKKALDFLSQTYES